MVVLVWISLAVCLVGGVLSVRYGQKIPGRLPTVFENEEFQEDPLDSPRWFSPKYDITLVELDGDYEQLANPDSLAPVIELPDDDVDFVNLSDDDELLNVSDDEAAPILEGDSTKLQDLEIVQSYLMSWNPVYDAPTPDVNVCSHCRFKIENLENILSLPNCRHVVHRDHCFRPACRQASLPEPTIDQLSEKPPQVHCPLCPQTLEDLPETSTAAENVKLLEWKSLWDPLKLKERKTDPFDDHLKSEGLQQETIPGDGNCLFASIADQLMHRIPGTTFDKLQVRELISDYIRTHPDDFPHITIPDGGQQEETIDEYCDRTRRPGTNGGHRSWGGASEIAAAMQLFECNIIMHLPPSQMIKFEYSSEEDTLTLHLAHVRNCHYNSCRQFADSAPAAVAALEIADDVMEAVSQDAAGDGFGNAFDCRSVHELDELLFMNATTVEDWKKAGSHDADFQGADMFTLDDNCEFDMATEDTQPESLRRVQSWSGPLHCGDKDYLLRSESTPDLTDNLSSNCYLI